MSRLRKASGWGALVTGVSALMLLAVSHTKQEEGTRLKAYRDSVGVPTICVGETKGVRMGMSKTEAECEVMLRERLDEFGGKMEACLPDAKDPKKMGPHTYVAFLSTAYNIGSGGFCRSSMVKRWNAGDRRGACDALLLYNRAGGRVLKGLDNRRKREHALCIQDL